MGKLVAQQHHCYQLRVVARVVVSCQPMQAAVLCAACRLKDLSMRPILCLIATWPSQCGLSKQVQSCTLAAQQTVRLVLDIAGVTSWPKTSGRKCSWQQVREERVHHEMHD